MKSLVPTGLLLVGMFVAGCNTPENIFMAGDKPIAANPIAPVAKVAPATPVLIVAPQNPKPVEAKPVETKPVDIVINAPPVVVPTNTAPVAPVVMVPDDAPPAATKPADVPVAPAVALPTIVTPDTSIVGKVVAYNSAGRFAVLSFPAGPMPRQDQGIFLYRGGLKVGEIKITGPQRDNNTVGDLVTGDAQIGDEVRDQ
jgi:hypothetical protein